MSFLITWSRLTLDVLTQPQSHVSESIVKFIYLFNYLDSKQTMCTNYKLQFFKLNNVLTECECISKFILKNVHQVVSPLHTK